MDAFFPILIVVTGISIGVVGLLIIAVFMWLHRRHKPSIPSSPPSSQAAFSITSSTRPLSEPSWDSVAVYSSEGGEYDNRAFDRGALQFATMQAFSQGHPRRQEPDASSSSRSDQASNGRLESNANPGRNGSLQSPSSGHDEIDEDLHVYAELVNHQAPTGHKGKVATWRSDQSDGVRISAIELDNRNPARGAASAVGQYRSSDSDLDNRGPAKAANGLHRWSTTELGSGNAFNGQVNGSAVRAPDSGHRASSTELADRNALRSAELLLRTSPLELHNHSSMKATSFKDATPVSLTADEMLPSKDSLQKFDAEGDLSVASLSTIVSEQSDASIVLTPLRFTLPPPLSPEESSGEMFI